jgi:hypothetical protein
MGLSDRAARRSMPRHRSGVRVGAALHARAARRELIARVLQQRVLLACSMRGRRRSLSFRHLHVRSGREWRVRGWSSRRSHTRSRSQLSVTPSRPSRGATLLVVGTACWNSTALLLLRSTSRWRFGSSTTLRLWTTSILRPPAQSTCHREGAAIRRKQLAKREVTLCRVLGALVDRPAAIGSRGRGRRRGVVGATRHVHKDGNCRRHLSVAEPGRDRLPVAPPL